MTRQCLEPARAWATAPVMRWLASAVGLALLLVTPAECTAQRYGRPFTLAESPQVLLEIKVEKNHKYLREAELRKLPRTIMKVTDPATKTTHVYEGVALNELVPGGILSAPAQIEIAFGSHYTYRVAVTDLDPQTKAMVVDTVDGKALSSGAPYYFLAKTRDKPPQTIVDVQRISVMRDRT